MDAAPDEMLGQGVKGDFVKTQEHRRAATQRWRSTNREHDLARQKKYDSTDARKASRKGQYRKRKEFIAATKGLAGCVDCHERDPVVLDFDHRPGERKLFNIGTTAMGVSQLRLLAEIAKCDVRCANCHRRITAGRRLK